MKQFDALTGKTYSYLTGHNNEDKKSKRLKKYVIKTRFKFTYYKNSLEETQLENKISQLKQK